MDMGEVGIEREQLGFEFHGMGRDPDIVRRNGKTVTPELGADGSEPMSGSQGDPERLDRRLGQESFQLLPVLIESGAMAKAVEKLAQNDGGQQDALGLGDPSSDLGMTLPHRRIGVGIE